MFQKVNVGKCNKCDFETRVKEDMKDHMVREHSSKNIGKSKKGNLKNSDDEEERLNFLTKMYMATLVKVHAVGKT